MLRRAKLAAICISAMLCAGCASTGNLPFNKPVVALDDAPPPRAVNLARGGTMLGLAFSGGGTRAAAFSYGVLKEVEATAVQLPGQQPTSLYDHISFISGVSGGSVLAAYVGVKNREALSDFREKFLLKDAEEDLFTRKSVINLSRALGGGVNEASHFTGWLDENLYHGATLGDFDRTARPRIYIYASDIYNSQPFVFSRTTFQALCSDYDSYPVSQAVAASAAVPFLFSPIVVESFAQDCRQPLPAWVEQGAKRQDSATTKAVAQALKRYRDASVMRYVKLVDGGVTDNFGVSGFIVDHQQGNTAYAPLTEEQAVQLERALVLVVNAGQEPAGNWARTLEGPSGVELAGAVTDTMIKSSSRAAFDAFGQTFKLWRDELVRWRCSLPSARVQALRGSLKGWNCANVKFYVSEVAFDQMGPERAKELSAIPTRFKLPQEQVDTLIAAGREALQKNQQFQQYMRGLPRPKVVPAAVTAAQ